MIHQILDLVFQMQNQHHTSTFLALHPKQKKQTFQREKWWLKVNTGAFKGINWGHQPGIVSLKEVKHKEDIFIWGVRAQGGNLFPLYSRENAWPIRKSKIQLIINSFSLLCTHMVFISLPGSMMWSIKCLIFTALKLSSCVICGKLISEVIRVHCLAAIVMQPLHKSSIIVPIWKSVCVCASWRLTPPVFRKMQMHVIKSNHRCLLGYTLFIKGVICYCALWINLFCFFLHDCASLMCSMLNAQHTLNWDLDKVMLMWCC